MLSVTDYHQAPEDQYVIQLKGGGIEVGSTEGQKEIISPVSIGRVRDITGRGHSVRDEIPYIPNRVDQESRPTECSTL